MKKKTVKLPKNWGLTKLNLEYLAGFNDGWETCKEVMRAKKGIIKRWGVV